MRVPLTLALLLATAFSSAAFAADNYDTLQLFLSKSPLVVVGKIVEEDGGFMQTEWGVAHYQCEVAVTEVLQGDKKLKGENLKLTIARLEDNKQDKHPLIRKDAECILFLQPKGNSTPSWETSDLWFGIQHPIPRLVKEVARLVAEKEKAAPVK